MKITSKASIAAYNIQNIISNTCGYLWDIKAATLIYKRGEKVRIHSLSDIFSRQELF